VEFSEQGSQDGDAGGYHGHCALGIAPDENLDIVIYGFRLSEIVIVMEVWRFK